MRSDRNFLGLPTFTYDVLDPHGTRQQGTVEADDVNKAARWLQHRNFSVLTLAVQRPPAQVAVRSRLAQFFGWHSVGLRELALFTRQLSMLLASGVHIIKALDCLAAQKWDSPLLAPMTADMSNMVRQGVPLSGAMEAYPAFFSRIYVSMVLAGERSGMLVTILSRLSDYLEKDYKFRAKLSAALAYPAVIFATSFGLLMFMMVYVFPRFMSFFNGLSIHVPWSTQVVLSVTRVVGNPWLLAACLLLSPMLLQRFLHFQRSPQGRYLRDAVILRVPVLDVLHRFSVSARFCRTASVLFECGLGQLQTLELLATVVGSPVLEEHLQEMTRNVRDNGARFSTEMLAIKFFPAQCAHLVAVGEEAGKMPHMLDRLADNLEETVDILAVQSLNLLEPIMLGIMGIAVGFVLWSVFVPVYELVQVI